MKPPGVFERVSDWLNPIVIKELRQAVQSKFVVALLLLFLLLQLVVLGAGLLISPVQRGPDDIDFQAGRQAFLTLQIVLLGTCMLFIPIYTGVRLAAERSGTNVDLLFITTLRPRAIIWGKLVAAVVLAVLIFSSFLPFMTFTYLLRGIDMPTILLVLAIDFGAVLASTQLAIFVASVSTHWIFRALLGLLALATLATAFGGTVSGTIALLEFGGRITMDSWEFLAMAASTTVMILLGIGLFFSWSVALISPPSSNRALPVRLYFLVTWLLLAVNFGVWDLVLGHHGPTVGAVVICGALGCLAMLIGINERESWTPRVSRSIPRAWWLRSPAFLFYSGSAGGLAFGVLLLGLTLAATQVWIDVFPRLHLRTSMLAGAATSDLEMIFRIMGTLGLYTFCYALSAVLLRKVSPLRVPAGLTWVVTLVLVAAGSLIPFLIGFIIFYREWTYASQYHWLLGNPIAAGVAAGAADGQPEIFVRFFTFAGVWAVIVAMLSIPWFFRQFRAFRPYAGAASHLGAVRPAASLVQAEETRTAG